MSARGVTVYPTDSFDWRHYNFSTKYHGGYGGGYGNYNPNGGSAFNEDNLRDNPARRGASYFFGFLITFIVLLSVFVCCGLVSRRKYLAAQRRRRGDILTEQTDGGPGGNRLMGFGGLMPWNRGADMDDTVTEADALKVKPRFHDVVLGTGGNERGGQHESGGTKGEKALILDDIETPERNMSTWFEHQDVRAMDRRDQLAVRWKDITPLSASVVRQPKDFEPYAHFEDTMLATNPSSGDSRAPRDPYWPTHPITGYISSQSGRSGDRVDQEAHQRGWLRSLLSWRRSGRGTGRDDWQGGGSGYQLAPVLGERRSTTRDRSEERLLEKASGQLSKESDGDQMRVAVVVAMPEDLGSARDPWGGTRVPIPVPEYQIGLARVNLGRPDKESGF